MPTALSSETLVNTTTLGDQSPVGVAALSGGRTAAAWIDSGPDVDVARVRLFDVTGQPLSAEITVGPATQASVTGLAGGGFVVVWTTLSAAPAAVRAQLFDAAGQAVGDARELAAYDIANTPTLSLGLVGLEVTGLSDGGYVAGWSVQRADNMGFQSLSSQIVVADAAGGIEANFARAVESTSKMLVQYDPDISFVELDGGRFLATWRDAPTFGPVSDPGGQMAQVYTLAGVAVGDTLRLDPSIPPDGGPLINPLHGLSAGRTPDGNLALAWNENGTVWVSFYPEDRLGLGINTHRTQPVAAGDAASSGEPQVTVLSDGRVLVAWSGADGDAMGRIFTAQGTAAGAAFVIGDTTAGVQDLVDVVTRADGAVVAVWRDAAGDSNGAGVHLQVLWPDGGGQVGTEAHDVLVGGPGGDVLAGRGGDDWLLGQGGADTLSGGTGADKFILTVDGAADRIVDFQPGADTLLLFDTQGALVDGSAGLLIWNPQTHDLSWDPDSDAGPATAQALASLPDLSALVRADFAAGFQPSGLRSLAADGGRTDVVFDWSGQAFDTATATYTADGRLLSYDVRYDDGAHAIRTNDVDNATPDWSTVVAEYDPQDRLFAYSVYGDDGTRTLWLYDTNNTKAWSRVIEGYDALGRLSVQAAANDDGTAWERHVDTYDTQPWAYYIDNFSQGSLVNHTYYNADGSVFAG